MSKYLQEKFMIIDLGDKNATSYGIFYRSLPHSCDSVICFSTNNP